MTQCLDDNIMEVNDIVTDHIYQPEEKRYSYLNLGPTHPCDTRNFPECP